MAKPIQKKDHKISHADASRLIKAHRAAAGPSSAASQALCFHRQAFDRILNQPGCVGIRVYPARHDDGSQTLVLVGIDAAGGDMVSGELSQDPFICPPECDPSSSLIA